MANPILSAIVAMSENRVIGKNNQLPWHLSADLKRFKVITTGHPIIMGRKTYESIGKPLPNRTNIIVTRDPSFQAPGCEVAHSLEEAVSLAASVDKNECFIIGGAEIYRQAMPLVKRLYLTIIHQTFEGDAYFMELHPQEWQEVAKETHPATPDQPYRYSFLTWEKLP